MNAPKDLSLQDGSGRPETVYPTPFQLESTQLEALRRLAAELHVDIEDAASVAARAWIAGLAVQVSTNLPDTRPTRESFVIVLPSEVAERLRGMGRDLDTTPEEAAVASVFNALDHWKLVEQQREGSK